MKNKNEIKTHLEYLGYESVQNDEEFISVGEKMRLFYL